MAVVTSQSVAVTSGGDSVTTGRILTADSTEFSLTGVAALLRAARRIAAGAATFTLTGIDAALTYNEIVDITIRNLKTIDRTTTVKSITRPITVYSVPRD